MRVRRVPSEASAAERARWLAEMAAALIDAQQLVWDFGLATGSAEAMELYARIEAAFSEVQALRLGRSSIAHCEDDPNWTEILPWSKGPTRNP